jgi:hypothetical protein
MSKTITWTIYGEMYDDLTKTFKEDFGFLLSRTTSLYAVSDAEDINDLYNITLETILEMGYSPRDITCYKDFVKKWDFNKVFGK